MLNVFQIWICYQQVYSTWLHSVFMKTKTETNIVYLHQYKISTWSLCAFSHFFIKSSIKCPTILTEQSEMCIKSLKTELVIWWSTTGPSGCSRSLGPRWPPPWSAGRRRGTWEDVSVLATCCTGLTPKHRWQLGPTQILPRSLASHLHENNNF